MYIRKDRSNVEGFVDPASQFSEEQLEGFWKEIQEGSTTIEKPIDLFCHKRTPVSIMEVLADEKYTDFRWKLHQPVCPCCLTTFSNYVNNLEKWFNEGRLAWYALALIAELDRKIFRENHLGSLVGELDNISQRYKNYLKDSKENLFDEKYLSFKIAQKSLEEYTVFLNNLINGKLFTYNDSLNIDRGASLSSIEYKLRVDLVYNLEQVIVYTSYNFLEDLGNDDIREEFLRDTSVTDEADGSLLLNYVETINKGEVVVPYAIIEKGHMEDVGE